MYICPSATCTWFLAYISIPGTWYIVYISIPGTWFLAYIFYPCLHLIFCISILSATDPLYIFLTPDCTWSLALFPTLPALNLFYIFPNPACPWSLVYISIPGTWSLVYISYPCLQLISCIISYPACTWYLLLYSLPLPAHNLLYIFPIPRTWSSVYISYTWHLISCIYFLSLTPDLLYIFRIPDT